MVAPKRKIVRNQYSFPVIVTDVEGQLTVTVGEVAGNMPDELNVREYLEMMGNSYLDFLDSLDIEGDVDDDDCEDEEEIPVPAKKPVARRK